LTGPSEQAAPKLRQSVEPDESQELPSRETGLRVGGAVEIRNIELVFAQFTRSDDDELPSGDPPTDQVPEFGITPRWKLNKDETTLGVTVGFSTTFPSETEENAEDVPYSVIAAFRLTYGLPANEHFDDEEIESFVRWQSVFNVWPYWREYLSSTINRAGLPRLISPVMRLRIAEGEVSLPSGTPAAPPTS